MISKNVLDNVAKFCFENKIILEILNQSDFNSAHYEKEDGKLKFIISIGNKEDKNLPKIINDGLDKLKDFIKQIPTE